VDAIIQKNDNEVIDCIIENDVYSYPIKFYDKYKEDLWRIGMA